MLVGVSHVLLALARQSGKEFSVNMDQFDNGELELELIGHVPFEKDAVVQLLYLKVNHG